MIHSTAIIHPKAKVPGSVKVGPYCVIDEGVVLGENCILGPYVYLTGDLQIGSGNKFFSGCVIGEAPQDLKYRGAPSATRIGNNNTFRENTTVHRANYAGETTVIGSNNLLMAGCHIAHNCELGDGIIVVNGALLGGHVVVANRALISGNCLVHQFCRIGTLAMMQGGSAISKDLPPYTVARSDNTLSGLNIVGLRRAGMSPAERLELRKLYHALFKGTAVFKDRLREAKQKFNTPAARVLLDFFQDTPRGFVGE